MARLLLNHRPPSIGLRSTNSIAGNMAAFAAASIIMTACTADNGPANSNAQTDIQTQTKYEIVDTINAPDGGYDYVSVDTDANRLYVGREYGVMTVDLSTNAATTLLERNDVAAVLLIPNTNFMLSTNNDSDNATIFNRHNGEVIADIATGASPDGALYEKKSGLIFVMNGDSNDVTVIDPKSGTVSATISVGGKPEAATADKNGRVYVNIEDTNEIAVIDPVLFSVVDRYPLAQCHEPTGIAYDAKTDLLISVCHNNLAKLIEASNGNDHGNIPIGAGADGSVFNPTTRIGYASCIDGTLTVYHLDESGVPTILQTLKTADGARTLAYDSITDRLYLPAATVEWSASGDYLGATKGFKIVVVGRSASSD